MQNLCEICAKWRNFIEPNNLGENCNAKLFQFCKYETRMNHRNVKNFLSFDSHGLFLYIQIFDSQN